MDFKCLPLLTPIIVLFLATRDETGCPKECAANSRKPLQDAVLELILLGISHRLGSPWFIHCIHRCCCLGKSINVGQRYVEEAPYLQQNQRHWKTRSRLRTRHGGRVHRETPLVDDMIPGDWKSNFNWICLWAVIQLHNSTHGEQWIYASSSSMARG